MQSRLYQLGELEQKPTNAIPNSRQLYTVCLVREDITRLDVDVIVNTTDPGFSGVGTLDRIMFQKGGPLMRGDCLNFGTCKEVSGLPGPRSYLRVRWITFVALSTLDHKLTCSRAMSESPQDIFCRQDMVGKPYSFFCIAQLLTV